MVLWSKVTWLHCFCTAMGHSFMVVLVEKTLTVNRKEEDKGEQIWSPRSCSSHALPPTRVHFL